MSGTESSPKTSLFGSPLRTQRINPRQDQQKVPLAATGFVNRSGRTGNEAMPATGAFMPQLNNALSGGMATGSLAQPMAMSPLMFQRLDKNTWRVAAPASHLFQTIAKILSQTYIIAGADRQTLRLSTEWDKFFIDGRLFRNRISVNVFPVTQRAADLIIKNNIEYYTQTAQKADENNPTQWLPTHDITDELERVLERTQSQLTAHLQVNQLR
jgi:hypothetical protein